MKAELKEAWIENLENGKFKQGHYKLYDEYTESHCCLAVLAVICNMRISESGEVILNDKGEDVSYIPIDELVGIDTNLLVEMNDGRFGTRKHSFKEIAEYIKENIPVTD